MSINRIFKNKQRAAPPFLILFYGQVQMTEVNQYALRDNSLLKRVYVFLELKPILDLVAVSVWVRCDLNTAELVQI